MSDGWHTHRCSGSMQGAGLWALGLVLCTVLSGPVHACSPQVRIDFVEDRLSAVESQVSALNVQVYEADPNNGANIGSWRNAAFGEAISVEITASYAPVTAGLLVMPSSIPVQATSMMKSEAN